MMGSHGWSLNNKKVCNNFEWRGEKIRIFESSQEALKVRNDENLTVEVKVGKERKNQIREMRQNQ